MAQRAYDSRQYQRFSQLRREVSRMAEDRTEEQAILQQESGPELLILTSFYPHVSPQQLSMYWARPELLQQWWPPQARVKAQWGEIYRFPWSSTEQYLPRDYSALSSGASRGFSWKWDPESDRPERELKVVFDPVGDIGTQVTVTHGTYTNSSKDQEARDGHLEGWIYFLKRLHDALA
jgi:uncharacterized protein YndB with AHSA1/START domain